MKINDKYQKTLNLENRIRSSGYNVISIWNCENSGLSSKRFQRKFIAYPHYIVYDFEALLKKRNLGSTSDLMIDCSNIPVSVAINDSLTKDSIFIENRDPEVLIKEFVNELTYRQEIISEHVWKMYPMLDEESLPSQVRERWMNWVNQVPYWHSAAENMTLTW